MIDTTTATPENPVILLEDPENLLQEPGAYPQDDGTVNVVMDIPLRRGDGADIYVVKLVRAPNTDEVNKAGGRVMLLQMYDSAHMSLLPKITEPQITERIYRQLSPFDQQNLIMGVCSFFGRSKRGGVMLA